MVELHGISKLYPGSIKKANSNITLDLRKGEILCIAGENGAGKTTLMKILCGLEKPDTGDIFINGNKTVISSPVSAKKLGIGMVHQHFMLFPEFTVAENIVMGSEPYKWGLFFDTKTAYEKSDKIINNHNFQIKSTQKVKDLTLGQMQQAEICRILNCDAQIIILDEPTSILTEPETNSLFGTLRELVSEGKSIILITHKIHEIKRICDRVAVLRNGELIGIRENKSTDEHEIARMITGEDAPSYKPLNKLKRETPDTEPIIEFENVTVRRRGQKQPLLDKVSFSANSGEIIGFAGVGGNGLGVIEAVLGGFLHPAEGKVLNKGKDISAFSIRDLRKEGLAYVPAERTRVGSARDASVEENLFINHRSKRLSAEYFSALVKKYNIEISNINEKASTLSGGNLQKLILAREIDCLKDYIVFSEPTWGLDISSSRFMMDEITDLRNKGAAVILISTDLDEILELADRIIVMYRGKVAAELENITGESIKEQIGKYMHGLKAAE